MARLGKYGVPLRDLSNLWTTIAVWTKHMRKVHLRLTVETTGVLSLAVMPSTANLLLYAVHQTSGWSRKWPGRKLAPHSPYELFSLFFPAISDKNSALFMVPSDIIFEIFRIYLKSVYDVLFRPPCSNYNISFSKIQAIAQIIRPRSLAKEFSGTVKEVLGTAKTMGFAVDLCDPGSIQKKIDSGAYVCNENISKLL